MKAGDVLVLDCRSYEGFGSHHIPGAWHIDYSGNFPTFAGWVLPRRATEDELGMGGGTGFRLWRFLVRYVSPLAVALVLLNALGLLRGFGLG